MIRPTLVALLLIHTLAVHAQGDAPSATCFTEILMEQYMAENEAGVGMPAPSNDLGQRGGEVVIPVVVHVIWNQTYLNVPDPVVSYIINQLDQDYNMENSNSSTVRPSFQSVRASAGIRFCLAQIDPNGNPTTGINHFQTTASWFNPNTQADAMKMAPLGVSAWDPTRYLNIWVCDINGFSGAGVAGYSYMPVNNIPGTWRDGVVIDAQLGFGFTLRAFTHEIGHYLGLKHPFEGNACTPGDGFSDTPPTNSATFSCANTALMKCGALTQYENFMDYSGCGAMFTVQQAAYMHSVLNGVRASMLSAPPACSAGVGVTERSTDQIRIFPNPTRDQVTITGLPTTAVEARITDRTGRIVQVEMLNAGSSTINLGELAAGQYLLTVQHVSGPMIKPLVIMH